MTDERGGYIRYTSEELDFFPEGGDAWEALAISPNMQIVLDNEGFITDIWDSNTKKLYDGVGKEIGTRDAAYVLPPDAKNPKKMTDTELAEAIKAGVSDMSQEIRAVTAIQKAINGKYKRFGKYKSENNKRRSEEKGQGYQRRYRIYRRYPVYTGTYRRSSNFTSGIFA